MTSHRTCWRAEAGDLGGHRGLFHEKTWKVRLWGLALNLQFSGFQSKLWGTSRGASGCCPTLRE